MASTAGLTEAWAAAEAALPEGLRMGGVMAVVVIDKRAKAGKDWTHVITGWTATTVADSFMRLGTPEGHGPTPAAALLALATRLSDPAR